MPDEDWQQIHATPQVWSPTTPRLVTPLVLHPTCAEHCSGRHEVAARLVCPRGHGVGFHVILHEWAFNAGHFWYSTEPVNGTQAGDTRCRDCGEAWQRR